MLHHDIRASLIYSCENCTHEWQIDRAEEPPQADPDGGRASANAFDEYQATAHTVTYLELVELDEVLLERAAQPMPTELGTLDALHLVTAVLWREMTASISSWRRTTRRWGWRHARTASRSGHSALNRVVTFSTESRRLRRVMAGDRGSVVLMLVLCSRSVSDFSRSPANSVSVRDRGVGGSNPLAPTKKF